MAVYNQESLREGGKRDYHRLRMSVKLHIEQAQRSKANGSCSKLHSCSFPHSHASGNRGTSAEGAKNTGVSGLKPAVDNERRRKGKGKASSSVPTGKRRTDDKRSKSLEARPATRAKIPCLWGARCRKLSCDYRHPPVCRNYKSGNRCIHGNNCMYRFFSFML